MDQLSLLPFPTGANTGTDILSDKTVTWRTERRVRKVMGH